MALALEDRKRYREAFWVDYRKVIDVFRHTHPDSDARFPTINQRLSQILVVYFNSAMMKLVDSATPDSRCKYVSEVPVFKAEGVRWHTKTGEIHVTTWGKILLVYNFFRLWGYVTLCAVWNSFTAGSVESASLVFGIHRESYLRRGTWDSFNRFLRGGPIERMHKEKNFVLQGNSQDSTDGRWLGPRPLIDAVKVKRRSLLDPLILLFQQVKYLGLFFLYAWKDSLNYLLYKDFPYLGVAQFLNEANFINHVYLTQADVQDQKLWLTDIPNRHFEVNLLWYSVNSKAFRYFSDQADEVHPYFFNCRCDVHYVWSQEEAAWVRSLTDYGRTEIVSPILFYLPENAPALPAKETGEFQLVVFDVAPHLRSKYTPSFYSYHKTPHCIKFIKDINEAAREVATEDNVRINVFIKPKRRTVTTHADMSYLDFLDQVGFFPLETHANVFDLLEQADIVVIALYSSPMFISNRGHAIYHDPTGEVINAYPAYPFSSSKEDLKAFIRSKIKGNHDA